MDHDDFENPEILKVELLHPPEPFNQILSSTGSFNPIEAKKTAEAAETAAADIAETADTTKTIASIKGTEENTNAPTQDASVAKSIVLPLASAVQFEQNEELLEDENFENALVSKTKLIFVFFFLISFLFE